MLFMNRFVPLEATTPEALQYDPEHSFTDNDLSLRNPTFNLQGQCGTRAGIAKRPRNFEDVDLRSPGQSICSTAGSATACPAARWTGWALDSVAMKYGLIGGGVAVQPSFFAPEEVSSEVTSAAVNHIEHAAASHEQVLVAPFHVGMKYTSMMSATQTLRWRLRGIDGVRIGEKGVFPYPNVERWVRRTATAYHPLSADEVGVIAVPHGSDYNWNETMREGLAPLTDDYHVAEAFSMVDPVVIERAVRELEAAGKRPPSSASSRWRAAFRRRRTTFWDSRTRTPGA